MNHERHPSSPDKSGYAVTGEKHKIIIFKEESFAVQGAAFEVYKKMGSGFLESVYQECLEREFALRKIPFKSQVEIRLHYKDIPLKQTYRANFICFDSIIIEIKAVTKISDIYRAQLLNCLKATRLKLGLLVNFSSYPKVTIELTLKRLLLEICWKFFKHLETDESVTISYLPINHQLKLVVNETKKALTVSTVSRFLKLNFLEWTHY